MDNNLDTIVWIPEETKNKRITSFVGGEGVIAGVEETTEDILPFNFHIALSVVEGSEDTMEEEFDDAISEILGKKFSLAITARRFVSPREG